MERHQVRTAVTLAQAPRHRANDFLLLVIVHATVTAKNPDQAGILVTLAQPFSIHLGISDREERLAILVGVMPEAAPGREEADVETALVCLAHDEIDMIPVIVL